MRKPHILLVEDDADIRELVRLYMEASEFAVIEADSVHQAKALFARERPDLLILDILLPDGSGLELCQQLRQKRVDLPMIFLSCKNDSEDIIAGLDLGGDDYMTKPFDPNILVSRVKAHLRRAGTSPNREKSAADQEGMGIIIESLTKREVEILSLIKAGYTNQEIAAHYRISLGTVKGYNNQLFSKLGAKNRTHAIKLAQEMGFFL